ncbi:MAG: 1,3-beta-galactosyl-N-acetylhexosamine phosphorylase N-terminal domain-containing protein [Roseburia faecis]
MHVRGGSCRTSSRIPSTREAIRHARPKVNWVTARRAILRKPIDRIGYGGYLKLATQFPDFIDYGERVQRVPRTVRKY